MYNSGIYKILNIINGKLYVGSAVNLHNRQKQHFQSLNSNAHYNSHLQAAWNLHGNESFRFEVIEYCLKDILIIREQFWIDKFKSCKREFGYNLFPTAGSPLGYKHTEEAKLKLSEFAKNKTEKHKLILSETHKGKPKSEEHKAAMKLGKQNISLETRQRMSKGQTGRVHSLETRIKMSEARKRKYAK